MSDRFRLAFSFTSLATGIAIFSMFFGAGNVIFPLTLGKTIGVNINYALFGLMLTAIGGPLLGLFSTILFHGDCKPFFNRIGSIPACILILLIIAIIGPFGAMPRCFTVAFSAISSYLPNMSMLTFSVASGALTLLSVYKRAYILPILGVVLSPLLLASLVIIIIKGFFTSQDPILTDVTASGAFIQGLEVGYDTMDLLASMFFAVVVWDLLKEKFSQQAKELSTKNLATVCFVASLIGGGLLGLIYVGLSKVAAENMQVLADVPQQSLLSHLAIHVLGSNLGFVANSAVVLACLTTVISLAATVADVLIVEFRDSKVGKGQVLNYNWLVVIIVLITVIFSNLGFGKLMSYLHPIVSVCYPAIIVLAICNILYKLFNFPWVKLPVYASFAASLGYLLYQNRALFGI